MNSTFRGIAVFLLLWLIMANSCMKFRMSDNKAKKDFNKAGVILNTTTDPLLKNINQPIRLNNSGVDYFYHRFKQG